MGRLVDQPEGQLHGNAQGAFGPGKEPRQLEPARRRDQSPQVVSGDIAADGGVRPLDGRRIPGVEAAKRLKVFRQDVVVPVFDLREGDRAAVAGHHDGVREIVGDIPVFDAVGAAGVGRRHAAEGRILAARGIRGGKEPPAGKGCVELAQAIAGLAREALVFQVDVDRPVHVAGEIDHDPTADGPPAKSAAGPPGVDRHAALAGEPHGFADIPGMPGIDHGGGRDLKDAAVRREEMPPQQVGVKVAVDTTAQAVESVFRHESSSVGNRKRRITPRRKSGRRRRAAPEDSCAHRNRRSAPARPPRSPIHA